MTSTKLPNQRLHYWVNKIRARLLQKKLSYALLPSLCIGAAIYWSGNGVLPALLSIVVVMLVSGLLVWRTKQFRDIDANSLLLHLNREFKQCEESAQLILLADESLSLIQKLQKQRIQAVVEKLLSGDLNADLPAYSIKKPILLTVVLVFAFILIEQRGLLRELTQAQEVTNNLSVGTAIKQNPRLLSTQVTILPAPYTKLPKVEFSELDISLVAGSTVNWQLRFNDLDTQKPLSLHFNDQQYTPLLAQPDGSYLASVELTQSAVYYIASGQQMIGDIHTIAMTPDRRPTIRFITPIGTITEISKNALPQVQARVEIVDDFALGKVEILASVASGSGEAVKFRDETFAFDSEQNVQGKRHFIKNWDLSNMGMQPGDELYFSVRAWDNRTPEPQQSRSPSKIIRWLDDQEQAIMLDGLLMDFMPEYFKSQRQIIIETEQLIAEKENVSQQIFDARSRDLGAAQSDLKQKYGQFLGDEFDSGTMHEMEQGLELPEKTHAVDDPEHEDEDTHQSDAQHAHQSETDGNNLDKSGYSQIIEQYGHAHGEADDGNFIKKGIPSPKLLMKRAIGNMWQAELFLQLSQPTKALPFENNALELINRAKKAERIYVKRLGFEPPPVTEKRRYQGDLSDVLSYERSQQNNLPASISAHFKTLLNTIKQDAHSAQTRVLTETELETIQQIKDHFANTLVDSPEHIKLLASLQKIQSTKSFRLPNCDSCIQDLQKTLWRLLPSPIAAPTQPKRAYSPQNKTVQSYQDFIQQQRTQP